MDVGQKRGRGKPSLETLQGVRAAMAHTLRKMKYGKMQVGLGNSLINGYTQLAHLLQDKRDTLYQKRLRVLWEAHERSSGLSSEAEQETQ